jgi:hypothetical protein
MKLSVLSESEADETAIRILSEAVLEEAVEAVAGPRLRSRNWSAVLAMLGTAIRAHHFQTDAEVLVTVVDSDEEPIHLAQHDEPGHADRACRLCIMRGIVTQTFKWLPAREGRPPLRVALGLAVPAIEGWYLCGRNHQVGEAPWRIGLLKQGPFPYTKKALKKQVYGVETPNFHQTMEYGVNEAKRVAQMLKRLEADFPGGFGSLANELRRCRHSPSAPEAAPPQSPGAQ